MTFSTIAYCVFLVAACLIGAPVIAKLMDFWGAAYRPSNSRDPLKPWALPLAFGIIILFLMLCAFAVWAGATIAKLLLSSAV